MVKDISSLDSIISNIYLNKPDPISQEVVMEVRNFLKHIKTKDEQTVIKILERYVFTSKDLAELFFDNNEEILFEKEYAKASLVASLYA